MNWKLKSLVQNGVAALPDRLAQPLYYKIQNKFGNPSANIAPRYVSAMKIGAWAKRFHTGLEGKVVLEVGTGRSIDVPLACWLMGASKIISVDLNRYLRPELMRKSLEFIVAHRADITSNFSSITEVEKLNYRVDMLESLNFDIEAVIKLINLDYVSPADASNLSLPNQSIDYHISLNVFEHIPQDVLVAILKEAKRLLKTDGAMIHFIDPSDHFAHTDESISDINFLKFSDQQWDLLGGNRFMYHNRMRAVQYKKMIQRLGLKTIHEEARLDQKSLDLLRNGFPLNGKFSGFDNRENAVNQFGVLLRN